MDFAYTSEQTQLNDSLRRWLEKEYSFDARKQIIKSAEGVSSAAWQGLVDLGLCALPLPEEAGGFGGNAFDMLGVMQEIGRGLVIEPYFATISAARYLQLAGGHSALLERVALGEIKLACALHERQARHELHNISTRYEKSAEGYRVTGAKTVVLHGAQADYLIVSARNNEDQRATSGIALFVVPTAEVASIEYRTIDGMRGADVIFKDLTLPASALLQENAWELLDAGNDYAISLLCSEAVGVMQALHATTLDYVKTRQQFGAPIGKSQVLQHRLAEMYMHIEQAQSMAMLAAMKLNAENASERRRVVSAAKAKIGIAAKYVGQQAVQLHGGIGVTDELQAAHYFKRLTMLEISLGDVDHHLARFIAQPDFANTAG